MKKKTKREAKAWKPKKKWIESFAINLKTGKTKYKYFVPKTPEEEKRLETEFNKKMGEVFDILLLGHFSKKQKVI